MSTIVSIVIKMDDDLVEFTVLAKPGSRRKEIRLEENGVLVVAVKEPAERQKANKAIIKFLAKELGIKQSQITIIKGHTSRMKRLRINGITEEKFLELINEIKR